jgi:drug/metabolite transporter (DMT)-like permease
MAEDEPLRPAGTRPTTPREWIVRHALGLLAVLIGAVSFAIAAIRQDELWSTPDHRVTIPLFVAALVVGVIAFVRQEPSRLLPLAGVALAGIAVALGWVIVVGAILLATAVIAYLMTELM